MAARRLACAALALIVASAGPLYAQDSGLLERAEKIKAIFDKPVYPVFKSVAPGGGFGPGVGVRTGPASGRWVFRTEALVTKNKYWNVDSSLQYPRAGWVQGEVYARARDMKRLDFYGLGDGTIAADRTSYRFLERNVGATIRVKPYDFDNWEFGGRIERLWPAISAGRSRNYPSIEHRFDEGAAPGLGVQPAFWVRSMFVGWGFPGGLERRPIGADVRLTHRSYRDSGDGRFDFGRVELEGQQRIPGLSDGQRLTLHQYYSTSRIEEGRTVPFYLQQTLGGTSMVRPYHENLLGSDGTQATLRGFRNLRFRAPHLLLLQAEYRFRVIGPVEATVFTEAASIAQTRSALSLRNLEKDAGFSLSYVHDEAALARIDFGFGGGEGMHVFFNFGGLLR